MFCILLQLNKTVQICPNSLFNLNEALAKITKRPPSVPVDSLLLSSCHHPALSHSNDWISETTKHHLNLECRFTNLCFPLCLFLFSEEVIVSSLVLFKCIISTLKHSTVWGKRKTFLHIVVFSGMKTFSMTGLSCSGRPVRAQGQYDQVVLFLAPSLVCKSGHLAECYSEMWMTCLRHRLRPSRQ